MSEPIGPYDPKIMTLPPRMETDRLIMLPMVVEDFDYHWECRSDAQVMAHFPKVADDRGELEVEFLDQFHKQKYFKFFYSVSLKDETGLDQNNNRSPTIATVLLRPYNKDSEIELGYMASPRVWGRGIIPEACIRLLDYGFNEMNTPHIVALISSGNKNSERVMEKLGFTFYEVVNDDERSPHLNKFVLMRDVWEKINTYD